MNYVQKKIKKNNHIVLTKLEYKNLFNNFCISKNDEQFLSKKF